MNGLHSIEVWLIALAITVAVLAGFGIFARWCAFSSAVPTARLERLCVGMKMEEVVGLLGSPREIKTPLEGPRQWLYGARMKRHILLIEFDAHGAVESFAHGIPGQRRHTRGQENL